jgi:UDP:flavonoid glycosyltransferase YjiC (YdhE family)
MVSSKRTVLFFTRGRGRGHAIPDLVILEELKKIAPPDLEWVFASYSAGAATLAEAGLPVIDLLLPDDAPFLEILVRATRTMAKVRADAVVSHEEFAVLPAAHVFRKPVVFLVDFFPLAEPRLDSLRYAQRILFIEHRGLFPEPREVAGRVRYLGPVLRPLAAARADRPAAREELGLAPGTKLISVIPGAWANEKRAPLFNLVLAAFRALPQADKKLIWVAGADQPALAAQVNGAPDVSIVRQQSPIERLMVASDLVVTKANRGTTIEAARLAVPSLSLSFGINRIDETIIPRLHSNLPLQAEGIDAPFLSATMDQLLRSQQVLEPTPLYRTSSAVEVAREILSVVAPPGP